MNSCIICKRKTKDSVCDECYKQFKIERKEDKK